MVKEEVRTALAPKAIGPYSQAVRIGRYIFLSGQIPIEPVSGELVDGGVGSQTRQVLKNLQAVVDASGASLRDVVKTTVYLTDLSTFSEMNAKYAEFFTEPYPARATVGVSALPKGAAVEIDAVVVVGDDV
ncbi:MAG: RidA family protein [Deltaproteobacteria bacterium]|nr:RidA family protein [Deltaproteobacteria bacterium]